VKVFDFDSAEYRERYREQGWIHVPGGVDPEFLAEITSYTQRSFGDHVVTAGGAKSDALYEFPPAVEFPDHLFDVVADVAGLDRATMTLSERHIKAYDADAAPNPTAHKDRLASQASVGLSISVPDDSYLVLYPTADRSANPSNASSALLERLPPERHPDVLLRDAEQVRIHDAPGDVVMFEGSTMWHLRRNSANTVNLYLKFNDFGSDPLGEDPATPRRRDRTAAALAGGELDDRVPALARQMDRVTREYTRPGWRDNLLAGVWNQRPLPLSESQFELLQRIDGSRRVRELAGELDGTVVRDVRELARHGVIDLL
jgi:hypothetical protein